MLNETHLSTAVYCHYYCRSCCFSRIPLKGAVVADLEDQKHVNIDEETKHEEVAQRA
jgi:hypothetical protein